MLGRTGAARRAPLSTGEIPATPADGAERAAPASGGASSFIGDSVYEEHQPATPLPWHVPVLVGLACLLGGWASRALALPPAGVSPLHLPAGIALACTLAWGWRVVPAVAVAEAILSWLGLPAAAAGAMGLLLALVSACGAAAQALAGAALVRRFLHERLALAAPRDIGRFLLLGGFAASAIGTVIVACGWLPVRRVPWDEFLFDAATGWLSQSLSICAVAPIVLTLVGRPRAEWAARRMNVGLPLAIGLALLAAMIVGVLRTDQERMRSSFEREATAASSILTLELLEPLRALEAMRSVFDASDEIDREGWRRATRPWLEGPGHLESLGYNARVASEDIPAFEARMRADGAPDFRVFERDEANTKRFPPSGGEAYIMTYLEPASRTAARLGLNSKPLKAPGGAMVQAMRSGQPTASARFQLTQKVNEVQQWGIVSFLAVYRGEPKTDAERNASVRGFVHATVRLDETLAAVLARMPRTISVCIVDASPGAARQRMAGAPGCENQALALSRVQAVPFAGRQWELRVNASSVDLPGAKGGNAWSFSIAGLSAISLLGALLLTVTGRTRRIEAAVDEARRAREAADAANAAKGDFLANMSHEIRTPMNAILGMSHLALKSGLNAQQHDYVLKVERSAQSLLGVIDDILDFSKIEAGKLHVETAPFDLGDVMETLANLVGLKAEDKGLELLFAEPAGLPMALVGDSLRLSQVLVNLGSNAVKFTERGEVVVGIEELGRDEQSVTLRFSVRDTGVGISDEQRQRLFRAFEQADTSTSRRFGGSGLGLAISRQLVQLMGGVLDVRSTLGQGSEFFFVLRLGLQAGAVAGSPDELPALGAARLLVVDDNASARQILASMAGGLGLEVDEARDGWDALRSVSLAAEAGRPYDVVLIDWKMPGMDGVACAQQMTALPRGRSPTVLMTTAFGRDALQQRLAALQVAVSDVLVKPVTPSSLFDACAVALGRATRPASRSVMRKASLAGNQAQLQGAHLLLVEDNEINAELATELLNDAGVIVTLASDGEQALLALARQRFDGVLMDCQMPLMDGYDTTRAIRAQPQWQALPIIAMTANAMRGDREKALAAGMNDHVAKPIDVDAMFDTLSRWVRPAAAPAVPPTAGTPPVVPADALAELPGIDASVGRASTLGNDKLYRRLLLKFRDAQADFVPSFRAALTADDVVTSMRLAHDLRALAGTLGARALEQSARALEIACSKGAGHAGVEPLLGIVERELERVLAGLRNLEPEKV